MSAYGEYANRKLAQADDAEFDALLQEALTAVPEEAKAPQVDPAIAEIQKKVEAGGDPMQSAAKGIVSGAATALEQTANFAIDAADAVENTLAGFGVGTGELIGESRIDVVQRMFGQPQNATEHAAKIFGQYMAPLGVVNKLVKGAGWVANAKKVGYAAGITSAITDPEDKRLSDLIQSNPALANPITELLASDEDDSRIMSRIKNGIESATIDLATLGIIDAGTAIYKSVRAGKELKKAKELAKIESGNPNPDTGIVVDEQTLAQGEAKINQSIDDAATQAKVKPATGDGAAAGPTPEQIKKTVKAEAPKVDATPEEKEMLINAEQYKGSATNIRDLQKELKATGRVMVPDDLHKVAKRGRVSDAENAKLAKKIFDQGDKKIDEMLDRPFGKALAQEERDALKLGYMQKQLEVENMISGVKNVNDLTEAELSIITERLDDLMAFDASIRAANSEAGRALRTAKIGLLDEGTDAMKAKKIKTHIKLHGGMQDIKETIEQIKQIQDSGIENGLMEFLQFKNAARYGSRVGDAAFEYWVNNVLSGPSTLLLVNPISNIAQTGVSIFETATAEVFGKLMGKGVVEGETVALLHGLVDGMMEGFGGAKKFWGGKSVGPKSKFMLTRKQAISSDNLLADPNSPFGRMLDAFGSIMNMPTKALSAQDVFFNMMHQRARINQISHRVAMQRYKYGSPQYLKRVGELKRMPTEGMMREAERFGQEHTLTTPLGEGAGKLGKSFQQLQKGLESVPFGVGKYAGAFMRVGANLVDRAVQRTPLSFLRAATRRQLGSGVPAQVQEEIAKMTFGTAVIGAAGFAAYNGLITSSGPNDPKMKKALKSSGWQEYSIRVGDSYVPTTMLGPVGLILNMSADVAELVGRLENTSPEQQNLGDELFIASSQILTNFFTPEFLQQGVPDLFSFVKDLTEGRRTPQDLRESIARFSTGFIPMSGAVRAAGNIWSPGRGDKEAETLWGQIRNEWLEVAGLEGFAGLPPELNVFGEEVYSPMGVGDAAKSAVFSNKRDPDDPVVNEILRLEMTGSVAHIESPNEETMSLRMPERTKRKGIGEGVTVPIDLTPEQYHDYVKLSAGLKVGNLSIGARPLKEELKSIINTDKYKKASDDLKKVFIKKIVSDYKSAAWQVMQTRPDIQEEFQEKAEKRINRYKSNPDKVIFGRGQ